MFPPIDQDTDGDEDHQGNTEHEKSEMLLQQGVAGFAECLGIQLPFVSLPVIGGSCSEFLQALIGLSESAVRQFIGAVLPQNRLPGLHGLLVFAVHAEQGGVPDGRGKGGRGEQGDLSGLIVQQQELVAHGLDGHRILGQADLAALSAEGK